MMQNTLRKSAKSALIGFTITAAALGGIQLNAQAIAGHNSNAPVSFDAGSVDWQDRQNRVSLAGTVILRQAGLTVRSSRMVLNYTDAGALKIQRLTATGGVQVTRGSEAASGDVAVYDFNRRIITLAGNVRLRRGGDTLNGGRMVIDLRTGVASVDGRASGSSSTAGEDGVTTNPNGRVTGTFAVPES